MKISDIKPVSFGPPDFDFFYFKFESLFTEHIQFDRRLNFIRLACITLNYFKSQSKTNFFIEKMCGKFNLPANLFFEHLNKIESDEKRFINVRIDNYGIAIFNRDWHYISNFLITPQYQIVDENDDVFWIIKAQRNDNPPEYIKISNDDWCSSKRLKKILLKKQFVLKCSDYELSILQEHIGNVNIAIKITQLGYNALSNSYFFSNAAIFSGNILKPDEFGIISINQKSFYMPYIKSQPFKNAKRFMHTENNISFDTWSRLFISAHQEYSYIPIMFYISSLFRDYSFKEKRISPLLYIKGIRGTGKSSVSRNLTACSGYIQEEISLKSPNTVKSLPRMMSQISNSVLWLDEFFNGLDPDIKGVLQSTYDGGGYEMAANTNGIETKSITIYSSVILTSNFLPDDQIFASRTVLVIMNENKKTVAQRTAYNYLLDAEKKGLSCVTIDLLKYRELITDSYLKEYDFLYNYFMKSLSNFNIENRMIENMCVVLTPAYILLKNGKISFNDDPEFQNKLLTIAKQNIINQNSILFAESDIFRFWTMFQYGLETGKIKKGIDYKFRDTIDDYGEPVKDSTIVIRFARIYKYYQEQLKQQAKLQHELLEVLKMDESYYAKIDSFRFFTSDDERKNELDHYRTTIGYQFSYPILCEKFGCNL